MLILSLSTSWLGPDHHQYAFWGWKNLIITNLLCPQYFVYTKYHLDSVCLGNVPASKHLQKILNYQFFSGMGQLAKGTILSDIWGRSRWQGQADVKYLVDKFANLGKFHPAWPRDKSWGEEKGRGLFELETGMPFLWRRECKQWDVGSGKSARFNLWCGVQRTFHTTLSCPTTTNYTNQTMKFFCTTPCFTFRPYQATARYYGTTLFPMLCLYPTIGYPDILALSRKSLTKRISPRNNRTWSEAKVFVGIDNLRFT